MRPPSLLLVVAALAALPCAAAAQLPPPPPDTLARACAAPERRQFDFWLGRWSVAPPGREPRAVNEVTRQAGGCFLREQYHTADGYTGSSVNWYDAAAGEWRQLWVDNGGLILHLAGGLDERGRMVLSGERRGADGRPVRDRITWVPEADATVRQIWDVSEDGGATWSNLFTGVYRRAAEGGGGGGGGGGGAAEYACQGVRVRVGYADGEARVALPDTVFSLPRAVSASGARYSDGVSTVWEHQGALRVELPRTTLVDCPRVGGAPGGR